MLVEEARVDEVRRLALHGAVLLAAAFLEVDFRVNPAAVERPAEVLQADGVEVLADVDFDAHVAGRLGVLVAIGEVGAALHGVGPLDRILEVLVESGYRERLATPRIPLVAEVEVLHVARLEVGVALHVAGQVEVVEDGAGNLAELGAVDRTAVGQAELVEVAAGLSVMLAGGVFVQLAGQVERGEEVAVAVFGRLGRLLVVAGVGDELHGVGLVAHAGQEVPLAVGHIEREVAGTEVVVALVVVAPLDLLDKLPGRLVAVVPVVEVVVCLVLTGAVLVESAHLECGAQRTDGQGLAVVDAGAADVLVQTGELAAHVVGGGVFDHAGLVLVVLQVAAAVRHVAVGIGVAHAPVEGTLVGHVGLDHLQLVCARELAVVGHAALMIELGSLFHIALGIGAGTEGITFLGKAVGDVLKLYFVTFVEADPRQVEHAAQTSIVVILPVGAVTQVVRAVVVGVVGAKERVLHVAQGLVRVSVVDRCHEGDTLSVIKVLESCELGGCIPVAVGCFLFRLPVGSRQTLCRTVGREARSGVVGLQEVAEVRAVVECAAQRDAEGVAVGHLLGVDEHEAAGEVGRIFGRRRLDDHHVVELRGGDDVEREGA